MWSLRLLWDRGVPAETTHQSVGDYICRQSIRTAVRGQEIYFVVAVALCITKPHNRCVSKQWLKLQANWRGINRSIRGLVNPETVAESSNSEAWDPHTIPHPALLVATPRVIACTSPFQFPIMVDGSWALIWKILGAKLEGVLSQSGLLFIKRL